MSGTAFTRLSRTAALVFALAAPLAPGCDCDGDGPSGTACDDTSDCPTGEECDPALGTCVVPRECDDASDCAPGYECDPALGVCLVPEGCVPAAVGCPCSEGVPAIDCNVPGDPAVSASCVRGRASCQGGIYGACVRTPDPTCSSVGVSAGSFDVNDGNSDQVGVGPEGEIILDPDEEQVDFGFLWIANTGENTVSKIDIETGREVARYASVRDSDSFPAGTVPAVPLGGFGGDASTCGNCPSRTAIDFHGDAFVANRAFGKKSTVTKFANAEADCIDLDADGIETSRDVNGDGSIDVTSAAEFLAEDDECILWTKGTGGDVGVARAIAIDAGGPDGEAGNVWVGLYAEKRVIALSGATGEPVLNALGEPMSVALTDALGSLSPYGAAVDGGGNLWVTGLDDGDATYLAKVNTFTGALVGFYAMPPNPPTCANSQSYGITVDTSQRVWVAGYLCEDAKVFVPTTEAWHTIDLSAISNTRGIATDLLGNVWVAHTPGKVSRFKAEEVISLGSAPPVETFTLPSMSTPWPEGINNTIGVGIDRNSNCWAVSRNDGLANGAATRITQTGEMTSFPVGKNPYTYSDFTGFGLFAVIRPSGWWRGVVAGCAVESALSDWKTLSWNEIETPPYTSVRLRLRVADTVAGLDSAIWYGPWDDSPVDLDAAGVPDARYMQIEVQLSTTDTDYTPSFIGFNVDFDCPGVEVP